MISKDNFFLVTPMLHEVSSGMIEISYIITSLRQFCRKVIFYPANVESIDPHRKEITLTYSMVNFKIYMINKNIP
jgi:NADH dehydrogenase